MAAAIRCLFATDLHGRRSRYEALWREIASQHPALVFLGGDLLPHGMATRGIDGDFLHAFLEPGFARLRDELGEAYPSVCLILGNDDGRAPEAEIARGEQRELWLHVHGRAIPCGEHTIYGYAYVPPSPFLLKDWERYDVSRFVDPGCVSPEEGVRTVPVPDEEIRFTTIEKDLAQLTAGRDLTNAVFLFHTPPYQTMLDRAALDGKVIDHVPLDPHVGSIAVRRFIEERQPLLTLHGHIHESTRLTGSWRDRIGRTEMFNAAHDGPELSLIELDLRTPTTATRRLLT
ncbi:MAG: metallophosphoesterase [Candidatus Eisenbacteria bacterium]|uniref:Metallophosphoesterase n=1 Tax=Eiseniibacteriota bacterium TaxID=2212470 RepID=A0A956RRG6_UNCEI|nr:metallophosphoesterase [Candidatus Eisenbacteria bacterium]